MNLGHILFGLALLSLPAAARAEDQAYAKRVKGKPVRKPPAVRVMYRLPEDAEPSATPDFRIAKVAKVRLLFVDVNGNGRFDETGVDGWTHERMPAKARVHYVFPLTETIVLGGDVVRLRVAPDGNEVAFTRTVVGLTKPVRAGLDRLNRLRLRNGLPPVPSEPTRSAACRKHTSYMTLNDSFSHEEIEGQAGWTKDGAYAGIHSVIDREVSLADASVRWMATLYHRIQISDPRLTGVGAAHDPPWAMYSPIIDRKNEGWHWPVMVPAPDSEDQPTRAGRERPLPYPDTQEVGYPVTVQFPHWNCKVENAKAVMRLKGPKGAEVPCYVSSPLKPAHKSRSRNDGAICLLAKRPLKGKTLYWVQVDYTWAGKPAQRTWTFRTGKARRSLTDKKR